MAKSKTTFMKNERTKIKKQKKNEKAWRKEERQQNAPGGGLDNMLAYVNEHGEIVSGVAPEKTAGIPVS
jgi:hypothetical protein